MLVIFTGISYKEIPVKNDQYIQGTPCILHNQACRGQGWVGSDKFCSSSALGLCLQFIDFQKVSFVYTFIR